jgi:hypothetical protein
MPALSPVVKTTCYSHPLPAFHEKPHSTISAQELFKPAGTQTMLIAGRLQNGTVLYPAIARFYMVQKDHFDLLTKRV